MCQVRHFLNFPSFQRKIIEWLIKYEILMKNEPNARKAHNNWDARSIGFNRSLIFLIDKKTNASKCMPAIYDDRKRVLRCTQKDAPRFEQAPFISWKKKLTRNIFRENSIPFRFNALQSSLEQSALCLEQSPIYETQKMQLIWVNHKVLIE